MTRLKKLIQPSTLAGIAGITIGLVVGINASLTQFKAETMQRYDISLQQWGRFQGYLFSLMPGTLGATLTFYVLSQLLTPTEKGDRAALKRIAESKLSQPFLTDEETMFWSKIAQESRNER